MLNLQVINRSKTAKEIYKEQKDTYHYLIALVNLSDGYLGAGLIKEAEIEGRRVYEESKPLPWKHVHNIAAICYGNILTQQGKTSLALRYYEEGIKISKELGYQWDILYGQIWRCLALADFNEPYAYTKLLFLTKEAESRGFKYLKALAATFALIAAVKLEPIIGGHSAEDFYKLLEIVKTSSTPGLLAQSIGAVLVLLDTTIEKRQELILQMINSCLMCEGIKGSPEIISKALTRIPDINNFLNENLFIQFQNWIRKYLTPIKEYKKELSLIYNNRFISIPTLSGCNYPKCEANCCYDGVYLKDGEEEKIKKFVYENPSYFKHLPEEYIVDGNWMNIIEGRKTATRLFDYQNDDFPKHFTRTRCVFAYDNGLCSLQKAATELDLHPWKIKPMSCWMFPLRYKGGQIKTPPLSEEPDPDFVNDDYPGFIKYLPCGKNTENGRPWYEILRQEILYLEDNLY